MSRICEVCGKERGFFTNEMVRGQSGQEVCKECLKKANISVARFGFERIYASEIRDKIQNNVPIRKKAPSGCIAAIVGVVVFFVTFGLIMSILLGTDTDSETKIGENTVSTESGVQFKSAVDFTSAYIEENIIGTNELHITVKNTSSQTIDAFDYKIVAYNTYGEKISNSFLDKYTAEAIQIKPGETYSSQTMLTFMDTGTTFNIAITRYHIKDTNETVTIGSSDQVWYSVKK